MGLHRRRTLVKFVTEFSFVGEVGHALLDGRHGGVDEASLGIVGQALPCCLTPLSAVYNIVSTSCAGAMRPIHRFDMVWSIQSTACQTRTHAKYSMNSTYSVSILCCWSLSKTSGNHSSYGQDIEISTHLSSCAGSCLIPASALMCRAPFKHFMLFPSLLYVDWLSWMYEQEFHPLGRSVYSHLVNSVVPPK
jgi:hypothetical protein